MINALFRIIYNIFFFSNLAQKVRLKVKAKYNEAFSFNLGSKMKSCGSNFYVDSSVLVKNPDRISIGDSCIIHPGGRIEAWTSYKGFDFEPSISIGNNVIINYDCHIGAINKIAIGNFVLIASRVFITDHFHGEVIATSLDLPPAKRLLHSKGPVIIEDNVWIGEGVCIMPNVTIGRNSIVGANSVVTKDVPENTVVGGVPAKIIKKIFNYTE